MAAAPSRARRGAPRSRPPPAACGSASLVLVHALCCALVRLRPPGTSVSSSHLGRVVARVTRVNGKVREREPDTRLQTLSTPPDHSKAVVSKRFYNYFSYRSLRCDRVSQAVRLRAHHGAALRCKSTLDVPCDTASTERTENARQRRTAPMPAKCAVICTPRDRRNTEDWSSGL